MMGNFGYWGNMGWIGMIIGLILTIAVIIAVIVLVVWAVRRMSSNSTSSGIQSSAAPTAREIAQARYARGEINREEYLRILSDLGN